MTGERPDKASAGAGSVLLGPLLAAVARARPDADTQLIGRAYDVAGAAHAGQRRKSGDPYLTHPVAVATILAEAGADDLTLCAALLHDATRTPGYSDTALLRDFGPGIAELVTAVASPEAGDAVGQAGSGPHGSTAGPASDARAQMIKLADRLHNLRTAAPLPAATRVTKSKHTLEVLVPLAAGLGLNAIGAELRDLATQTLSPQNRATPTARLLATASALLPAATRARWRDEWAGELSALPTRRQRTLFALRTFAGIPRLAVTLRRSQRTHDDP